jgi:hypothetical protein
LPSCFLRQQGPPPGPESTQTSPSRTRSYTDKYGREQTREPGIPRSTRASERTNAQKNTRSIDAKISKPDGPIGGLSLPPRARLASSSRVAQRAPSATRAVIVFVATLERRQEANGVASHRLRLEPFRACCATTLSSRTTRDIDFLRRTRLPWGRVPRQPAASE